MSLPSCDALEAYLHSHIPVSKAMGVMAQSVSPTEVVLAAPLDPNINHKSTVFGGSLGVVATLACWSLVYVNLMELTQSSDIVITHGDISYLRPVNDVFEVSCVCDDPSQWERFFTILKRKGRARITLDATVGEPKDPCVIFSGTFAAIAHR